jgi:hypothetical protein
MEGSVILDYFAIQKQKPTPWPLVGKGTISTKLPPLVGEFCCQLLRIQRCPVVSVAVATDVTLDFIDRSHYFLFQVALHLSSLG